jgi:DNA-binding winged helix-turn-helix (wHTH) protein
MSRLLGVEAPSVLLSAHRGSRVPGDQHTRTVTRFGPFEADLQTQELRKQGRRLRLPGQSFQILKRLLERPGELVTREELRAALLPSDTFVDFEHGLNAGVNRLREALGDSADSPRFVETLPRRGYRFIVPVEWNSVGSEQPTPVSSAADVSCSEASPGVQDISEMPPVTARSSLKTGERLSGPLARKWLKFVLGVVSLILLGFVLTAQDWRPCFRRYSAASPVHRASAVSLPKRPLGSQRAGDPQTDGPPTE